MTLLCFVVAVVDSVMFAVVYIVMAATVAVAVAALVSSLLAVVLAAPEYALGNRGFATSFFNQNVLAYSWFICYLRLLKPWWPVIARVSFIGTSKTRISWFQYHTTFF